MKIIKANIQYLEEAVDIAFTQYKRECEYTAAIDNCCRNIIREQMQEAFRSENGFLCLEGEKLVGYLVYHQMWKDNGTIWCMFSLWGYGAVGEKRVKILSMLFQTLADKLFGTDKVHFEIKLYAHDTEIIHLFSMLQFGIQCEEGVHCINKRTDHIPRIEIKELTAVEIQEKWDEIWRLLQRLIDHLRKSPVFYPGIEFTEEIYKEFFLEQGTRVVTAQSQGQMMGLMTACKDGNSFINSGEEYYNVGDTFVLPEHRDGRIAQEMLLKLSEILASEGRKRLWVEHGTANPNARGFWSKYFTTYSYTMIREIEPF